MFLLQPGNHLDPVVVTRAAGAVQVLSARPLASRIYVAIGLGQHSTALDTELLVGEGGALSVGHCVRPHGEVREKELYSTAPPQQRCSRAAPLHTPF